MRAKALMLAGAFLGVFALAAPAAQANEIGIVCSPSHQYDVKAGTYTIECSNTRMESEEMQVKVGSDVPWIRPSVTNVTLPAHRTPVTFDVKVRRPLAKEGQVVITFQGPADFIGGVAITMDTRPKPVIAAPQPTTGVPILPYIGAGALVLLAFAWFVKKWRARPKPSRSYGF